ncbi:MAG: nitroreductase [Clostridiaceae bacterium]|nr:nitroreductase [Clostridiaceae bacterium]
MTIKQAISNRKSIRTYKDIPITHEIRSKLEKYIKKVEAPFDTKQRFILIDKDEVSNKAKLGTYGVISGAKTFICAVTEPAYRYEENLGYAFEKIILYATSLGLGTCWLGGTFNKSGFSGSIYLKDKDFIPVVTPVGYAKEKRNFIDQVMSFGAGSKNRKDWSELFFNKNLDTPLKKEEVGPYKDALEMVRLAPSASNKQPWRIVKDENTFHFFLRRTIGYKSLLGYDIQRLDIGIAMCHFELTINELGFMGKWTDEISGLNEGNSPEYIVSYKILE